MKEVSISSERYLTRTPKPARLDRLARHSVLRRLRAISYGSLLMVDGTLCERFGEPEHEAQLCATIRVHDARFYSEVAFGGTIGAGEAFMLGYWSCDDLTKVVQILLRNRPVMESMESGTALLTRPIQKFFHWVNRNTRKGSHRNISAHYDLGNEFFALWLDQRMMYSSAVFERPEMTLDEASHAKLDRICRKLQLTESDEVIEIGTGWGGFAIHAAKYFGCRVTTTTISRRQYEYACAQVKKNGLGNRVTLLLDDYRDLQGSFDKLVSIEMVEAVGHRYHGTFFRKCADLLKPDGLMLLQSITIADQRYDQARKSVDFIQRYIFPGGCLPSVTAILETLTRETDMRVMHVEDFGTSYAKTLAHWRERLFKVIDDVRHLGYSDEFIRLWHYYLSYCEGAFLERATGVVHMLVSRPHFREDTFGP